MSRLTAGRYTHAFVDEDLSVRVEAPETGAVVDLDRLSVGTQKQAYLVQRLELVHLLCPGGGALPVLLDDPFAHFDADRLARTLEWLAEAAAERQIILFATQRRVAELAPDDATVVSRSSGGRRRRCGRPASGGRRQQPLDMKRRQAQHRHVPRALEADVARPPLGVELAVEAEQAVELERAVEADDQLAGGAHGAGESSSARRTSAKTEKLRDSSSAPSARAQAAASQIRNSIRPFGVPKPRRIAESE